MPISVVLLYLVYRVRGGQALHAILLVAVAICVPLLALLWSEKHRDLMGAEGANALAEEDALRTAGIPAGRFAPSLTERQAHYRMTMLAVVTDEKRELAASSHQSM
jgi:hypothetical protein